jgi:hypothetical protein
MFLGDLARKPGAGGDGRPANRGRIIHDHQ